MSVIELKGGLLVESEAMALLVGLEMRGCAFRMKGERLVINPASVVTDEERAAIERLRPHLLAILGYEVPE